MTTTDEDLENRIRRGLAELGAVPRGAPRELRLAPRRRPAFALVVALAVVLALVAATVGIVGNVHHRSSTTQPAAVPPSYTVLEQPSSVTGSSHSILATHFTQVCERWRRLPTVGVDCTSLQARYVWSPGATRGPYTYSAIEVVGRPDPKIAIDGTVKGAYPLSKTVSVRGHRARLFGTPNVGGDSDVVTMIWNERADLQVFVHVSSYHSALRYPTGIANAAIAFAHGMRPVGIDPDQSRYVIRTGGNPPQLTGPRTRPGPWTLSCSLG